MTRQEYRTIIRHRFSDEENSALGDAEINSLINQAVRKLCVKIEGQMATSTLTAAADGFCTLPAGVIRLRRVEYNGSRMGRTDFQSLLDRTGADSEWCDVGSYYYMHGTKQIGTFEPVAVGASIVIYYETYPTNLSLDSADDTVEVDAPVEWEQAIIDFCVWKAIPIVRSKVPQRTDLRDYANAMQTFLLSAKEAGGNVDRQTSDWGQVPRIRDF